MFFLKKNRLVGLDIGSRTLKLAEIIDTNAGSTLKNFSTIDIEPGLIEEGSVRDPEAVSGYIRELFKSVKLKDKNVAISIGGYSVIVKKINVQTMTEDELHETIHFEAEQYIPFDISEVNLDFQILGESEHNPHQMNVLLVAAKKEMISEYINLMKMAKLQPRIIDVDAFALQNIFKFNYSPEDENIALIDIGASKTSLNILKDNVSEFMRDVSLGCEQINDKIASTVGCTIEETEKIKLGEESDLISAEDLKEIVVSVVTDWCIEIKRALDFFYSTYPEEQISRIVLSGGGANIKKFLELLAGETSADVEVINPFQNLIVDNNRFDSSYLEQIAPQAAICMGLATRKIGDK
ncbi:MAG: pilus assembly protein PilM [Desulfobacteraceae bacterium]|nr:pilus assembly protein PilM [Desulfobacteraceae bacterium]MDH3720221.1 pilus assembly protein PilM [Desulfobacteraceae bacterium]MDH3835267.1 pilus assembly protein PilM [Desulfobacteraceae bacterium]MDH3874286.1 pilus assembly protein PilM [Desulfobacteraceae bacterium]MDH3882184.1 pilus assembly protein PilM [Desulfobacteraceae bacterium]